MGTKRGCDSSWEFSLGGSPFSKGGSSSGGAGAACRRPRLACPARVDAAAFLASLGLNNAFFDDAHDCCYCGICGTDQPKMKTTCGKQYELPHGFVGFGIKSAPRAASLRVFDEWVVAYHGLKCTNLASILNEGGLLMPGDELLDGTTLRATHTRDVDRRRLYTSPSIYYSEKAIYTEPSMFKGQRARIVLQCRQKNDFQVCGETIGWESDHPGVLISPNFLNSELEWFTTKRGAIIPYRILIKMESSKIRVQWPFGLQTVSLTDIAKCDPQDFWRVGDIVVTSQPLTVGAIVIPPGTLGELKTLKTAHENIVDFFGKPIGLTTVSDSWVRKCNPSEFLKAGDFVEATSDLDFQGLGVVTVGSLGKLTTLKGRCGYRQVDWGSYGSPVKPICAVRDSHVKKVDDSKLISVGKTVRALKDMHFPKPNGRPNETTLVCEGDFGTIKSVTQLNEDLYTVAWTDTALLTRCKSATDFRVCRPSEFFAQGDWVRPSKNLTFSVSSPATSLAMVRLPGKLAGSITITKDTIGAIVRIGIFDD